MCLVLAGGVVSGPGNTGRCGGGGKGMRAVIDVVTDRYFKVWSNVCGCWCWCGGGEGGSCLMGVAAYRRGQSLSALTSKRTFSACL